MNSINSVVTALVTNVEPGRIKASYRWLDDQHETDWMRIATMMGGANRGSFMMPKVNDEALVAFDHGDTRFPYVVGFLWNGQDPPPGQHIRDRKIVSENGHMIRFIDATPDGGSLGALVIEDAHGNRISMSNGKIRIESVSVLEIVASKITLSGPGYERVVTPNSNPI
jgi:uncharacterized protein involved in type VI secretion and phage assembly